jgi:hypothetical protein
MGTQKVTILGYILTFLAPRRAKKIAGAENVKQQSIPINKHKAQQARLLVSSFWIPGWHLCFSLG